MEKPRIKIREEVFTAADYEEKGPRTLGVRLSNRETERMELVKGRARSTAATASVPRGAAAVGKVPASTTISERKGQKEAGSTVAPAAGQFQQKKNNEGE